MLATLSERTAAALASLRGPCPRSRWWWSSTCSHPNTGRCCLFDTLGLGAQKIRARQKTAGAPTRPWLEKLEADHPVVPLVLGARTLAKLKKHLCGCAAALVEPETGRAFHTDFTRAVTATDGSPSSSSQPAATSHSARSFQPPHPQGLPPQEGLAADSARLLQIELRHPHPTLRRSRCCWGATPTATDVHALTARCYCRQNRVTAGRRRPGQNKSTFGCDLRHGRPALRAPKQREQVAGQGVSSEIQKKRYPGFSVFWSCKDRLGLSRGYVETIWGRRRPSPFAPVASAGLKGPPPSHQRGRAEVAAAREWKLSKLRRRPMHRSPRLIGGHHQAGDGGSSIRSCAASGRPPELLPAGARRTVLEAAPAPLRHRSGHGETVMRTPFASASLVWTPAGERTGMETSDVKK